MRNKNLKIFRNTLIKTIAILGLICFFGMGCGSENVTEEQLPQILKKCSGLDHNLKNAIVGFNKGFVSVMQKGHAVMMYTSCLRDAGLSKKQAKDIVDEKMEEYKDL